MAKKPFKVYSSSAGSGKTYTLSKSYLQLVIKNPSLYKNILAVTFTNKAAWEMKSRILNYLYQLSSGVDCPVLADLVSETGLAEEKIRDNADMVLSNVLHNFPLFSIKTIDSFFQGIVQAFAKELGLQGGFEIELDQENVLDDLVDRVMLDVGKNDQLTNWLIRYSENRVNEGKSWDIKEDIKKLAWEIFNENFKAFEDDIKKNAHIVPELLKSLGKITSNFEKTLKELGKSAIGIIKDHGLQVANFSYGKASALGYFEKIAAGQVATPGVRVYNASISSDGLYKKGDSLKEKILKAYDNGLKQISEKTIAFFELEYPNYTTATAITRYIYTLGILSDISLKLGSYRDENQVLLISDLADFLKKIIQGNDAPFIYEKSGTRYKHFMIDEFQDTSGFQWENFKPLIKNSLAEGHFNMAVGDVKQSIYRWRGGNWELLLKGIYDDIGLEITEKLNLDTNFRSHGLLIRFFNSLFTSAPSIVADLFNRSISTSQISNEDLLKEISKINLAYEDARQKLPLTAEEDKGYIKIKFFENEDDEDWQDLALESIPEALELLQDDGYPLKDVAFLVRTKAEGEKIINFLMHHKKSEKAKPGYQYEAISSESLYLSSACSIQIIIQALEYLNNPDNNIALFNLVLRYQVFIQKNPTINSDHITRFNDKEFIKIEKLLPERFFDDRKSLISLPLYEIIESLIRIFDLSKIVGEGAFIQSFLDQVISFVQKDNGEVNSFLDWWEKKGKECSIQMPEEVDVAKVLTIHKSKGLQFSVVFIPFCNWDLDHHPLHENIIWCETENQPFNLLKQLPVKYSGALKDTHFSKGYYQEKIKVTIDNINLLYVAVTRAQEQLIVYGNLPSATEKDNSPLKSASDLLYHVINSSSVERSSEYQYLELTKYWNPAHQSFEAGYMEKKKFSQLQDKSSKFKFISTDWRSKVGIKISSNHVFTLEEQDEKIRFGKLVHKILSLTRSKNDLTKVMNDFYYQGLLNTDELALLTNKFEKVFENAQIEDWFNDKYTIKTESSVLLPNGTTLRPDRVIIDGDRAITVDFKTGKINPADKNQVKDYMKILKQMGFAILEGYILYLDQIELLKVENN